MIENVKYTAVIVEDEINARIIFKSMLNRYAPNIEVIDECSNVMQAVVSIESKKPDILFLDIQMPDGTGFDVLEQLDYEGFHLVFVTAFDHYAIKAIKFHAFDYLLKPVDYLELKNTVAQLELAIEKGLSKSALVNYQSNTNTQDQRKHRLAIPGKEEHTFVPIEDILMCQAEQSYTWIVLADGQRILSSKNLGEFEKVLPSAEDFDTFFFYRIHYGYIVNTKYIKKYNSKDLKVELMNGESLGISRRRKIDFQYAIEKLDQFL